MPEVIVIARARAKEGKEQEMADALLAVVEPSRAEQGCVSYTVHRGLEDRRLFMTYERWRSPQDVQTHMATTHVAQLFAMVSDLVDGTPEIVAMEAI